MRGVLHFCSYYLFVLVCVLLILVNQLNDLVNLLPNFQNFCTL